jgi:D-3-phosphoglycerate dehydrogenase
VKTIAVTSSTICARPELRALVASRLGDQFHAVFATGSVASEAALAAFLTLASADGLLIGREEVGQNLLRSFPRIKAVSVYGVGYDNVDQDACRDRGVELLVAPGVNADAVAEHTLGLMLAVLRNISANDRLLHAGRWNKDGGRTLFGKTVAVIGAGHVGSRVARLLRAFSCPVVLNDILPKADLAEELGACELGLESALQTADIVTVHVPLSAVTRGLFGDKTFSLMKAGAVLINTSRGAVVDLAALERALASGQIAGTGLDVFENEPIVRETLFAHAGVVGTPHTAGNAKEAVEAMAGAAASMLRDFFEVAR